WLPLPAEWAALTVETQLDDPDSTLEFFRRAIQLRHGRSEFGGSAIEWLDSPADSVVFRTSGGLVCVLNAGRNAIALPRGEVLMTSGPQVAGQLPPHTAAWLV
ncbi:MAG TPA: DUF3459 domain-containing protein, partial [Mycobacterium sp.]|nr:DUF3459 domain-containing protein [Mycobacterium sp.]